MQKYIGLAAVLFLGFFSCAEPEGNVQQASNAVEPERPSGMAVSIVLPRVQLKEKPEADSNTRSVLQAGDSIYLSGEASRHRSQLTIKGRTYERAWLFGQTADGTAGWIHGAAVAEGLPRALQLRAFFEPATATACLKYIDAYQVARRGEAVLPALRQAQQLQVILSQYPDLQASVPEWLNTMLPGLQATWLEDKQRFDWYVDYGAFLGPAQASPAEEDERLLELYYLVYPLDSIGYRYPGWMLETAPGKAYSLLGRGKHLAFIEALSERRGLGEEIQQEISQLQQLLLNDIQQQGVAFWEKRERVLQELRQLAAHPGLDAGSRKDLELRLQAWAADSLPGQVIFNHRAGLDIDKQPHEN